jgi:hypothetical protein
VFEEDKVVLKAALRQLQKEITEEAPKAQKLMDDLAKAEQGELVIVPTRVTKTADKLNCFGCSILNNASTHSLPASLL